MKLLKEVRWGIIGCGDVTEVKSGPALYKMKHSYLTAVMRRNGALAKDYAQRHHVPKWYEDADALIQDPEVDAVYVATPPSTHMEYAIRVAEAGKPAYVEKPMARTFAECQTMLEAFQSRELPLFVAYYRRCLPRFVQVKKLLEKEAIGEIRSVNLQLVQAPKPEDLSGGNNWRVNPEIAGGGYFYDLASHQLDLLDYMLGPISAAKGFKTNQAGLYAAEDTVSATFQFQSGVLGSGNWCFASAPEAEQDLIEIIGAKGKISFSTFAHKPAILLAQSQEQHIPPVSVAHIQQPLIQTVVDELCGKGICPSTGKTAARTNWVMDQIMA